MLPAAALMALELQPLSWHGMARPACCALPLQSAWGQLWGWWGPVGQPQASGGRGHPCGGSLQCPWGTRRCLQDIVGAPGYIPGGLWALLRGVLSCPSPQDAGH